ncbi:hypothetical protein VIBR0546_19042 [Vibrio brasiliensis LMG 20546]|uniref:Uncharacterized protein n=1 Tax=Vibrio brasiliensis LMG 20546 TaxID=945543 RepID=E8M098_9VIBR|nr:hypothetical protein VIBR0546_19042 [Vibrio brasiliensis LMG 20546]
MKTNQIAGAQHLAAHLLSLAFGVSVGGRYDV